MDSGQFELGAYRLDAQSRMLFREGRPPSFTPKVAKILVAPVQAADAHSEKDCVPSVG
jgi:hypothetical protein